MPPSAADLLQRQQSNAEILLWQARLRVGFVATVGTIGTVLRAFGLVRGSAAALAALTAAYLLLTTGIAIVIRGRGRAGGALVSATVGADLLFIFSSTLLATAPEHYERALLLSLFTLQLTEAWFGRGAARWTLGAVCAGYGGLVAAARARGAALMWAEEGWILCIFAAGSQVLLLQYGNLKRRLSIIASLFAAAEEGDFTRSYDVAADRYPDSITMVGRAYNRVRAQLATMVLTDPLSGCVNRRGFEQELTRAMARASRAASHVALLALDVDHFKDVNDTFGHLVGDGVVREVGTLLRGAARAGDVVARIGGDEFMLLLPDTDEPGALQVAARIRDSFRQRQWDALPEKHRLTASVGAVADRAADADLAEALLARADEALYAAKRSGRDRVFVWQHGILRPVTGAYRVPDPAELAAEGPGADGAPAGEGPEGTGERGATGNGE